MTTQSEFLHGASRDDMTRHIINLTDDNFLF